MILNTTQLEEIKKNTERLKRLAKALQEANENIKAAIDEMGEIIILEEEDTTKH